MRITEFYTLLETIDTTNMPDMTSLAVSSWQVSEIEQKTAEIATADGFGSNFSGASFCLSHQLVGFLLFFRGMLYENISMCSEKRPTR